MQNVRANVKVIEFQSLCIFFCILTLLIILIEPLKSKAYDRRASGDCGTSGYFVAWGINNLETHLALFAVTPICQVKRAEEIAKASPFKADQYRTLYVCGDNGEFSPQQCDSDSYCWCVNGLGEMVQNSKRLVLDSSKDLRCGIYFQITIVNDILSNFVSLCQNGAMEIEL